MVFLNSYSPEAEPTRFSRLDPREGTLACLQGNEVLARRFHSWRGLSGLRYITTIYPNDGSQASAALPDLGPAVLMAVVRRRGDNRAIAAATAVECGSDWAVALMRLSHRADEWHVHLLAQDRTARLAAAGDLHSAPGLAIVA